METVSDFIIFLISKIYLRKRSILFCDDKSMFDPDVIRTRSLLIWSQTRYRCATESAGLRFYYYIQWRSPIQLLTFYDIHNFYQPQYQCHSGLVVRALAHFSCVLCVMSSNPQWVWTCWRWEEEYFETARGLGVTCFSRMNEKGFSPAARPGPWTLGDP